MRYICILTCLHITASCSMMQNMERYHSYVESGSLYPLGIIENFDQFKVLAGDRFSEDLQLASIQYCFRQSDYHQRMRRTYLSHKVDESTMISQIVKAFESVDSLRIDTSSLIAIENTGCPVEINVQRWRISDRINEATIQVKKDAKDSAEYNQMHIYYWHTFSWGEQLRTDTFVPGNPVPTGHNHNETSLLLAVFITSHGELIYRNAYQAYRKELGAEDELPELKISSEFFVSLANKTILSYTNKLN